MLKQNALYVCMYVCMNVCIQMGSLTLPVGCGYGGFDHLEDTVEALLAPHIASHDG
jgi:hypothetical protein